MWKYDIIIKNKNKWIKCWDKNKKSINHQLIRWMLNYERMQQGYIKWYDKFKRIVKINSNCYDNLSNEKLSDLNNN